ncbi:hypothetical protein D9M69_665710 [compost metagenome]
MGFGSKTSSRIKNGTLTYNDKVIFISSDSVSAKIVGVNSSYLFYITEDSPSVKISPTNALKYFERQPVQLNFDKLFKKSPSSSSGK